MVHFSRLTVSVFSGQAHGSDHARFILSHSASIICCEDVYVVILSSFVVVVELRSFVFTVLNCLPRWYILESALCVNYTGI